MTTSSARLPLAEVQRPSVRRRPKLRPGRVVHDAVAVIGTIAIIGVPLWLLVITSGKSNGESASPSLALPTSWHFFDNYGTAFSQGGVLLGLVGSLLVTLPTVFLVLALGAAAAWILARRKSRLIAALYGIGISGIILPPAVITTVLTLKLIGIDGSIIGAIGVYGGGFMATAIFFITGFVRTIPVELEEAARIDGAAPVAVFFRIILPLLQPVLATAAILVTISVWNEVFLAFFILSGGPITTMPLGLYNVASQSEYVKNWNLIFAYVVIMSIPMIAAFVLAQRRIIAGVTSGAVK